MLGLDARVAVGVGFALLGVLGFRDYTFLLGFLASMLGLDARVAVGVGFALLGVLGFDLPISGSS